jgi:hypothetical protein
MFGRGEVWRQVRWLVVGLGIAALGNAASAAPAPRVAIACPPPWSEDADPLPHVAAALKRGATLEILAVGSATVFGPATGPAADAAPGAPNAAPMLPSQTGFPWQAARALEAAVRGVHVNVTVVGRRFMTAADMLVLLRQELRKRPYRLVLWQTGTVEAVQELSPDDLFQTLADGAALVTAAGADLVLIDPQYSRFLAENANMEPYTSTLQAAATLPGVVLFHRFDIMRDWASDGIIDLERSKTAERAAVAARLHACLGRELARELLADAAVGG